MADTPEHIPASDQLREQIHADITRYGQESGITVYQAIGVLECVKMDLWDTLTKVRKGE